MYIIRRSLCVGLSFSSKHNPASQTPALHGYRDAAIDRSLRSGASALHEGAQWVLGHLVFILGTVSTSLKEAVYDVRVIHYVRGVNGKEGTERRTTGFTIVYVYIYYIYYFN